MAGERGLNLASEVVANTRILGLYAGKDAEETAKTLFRFTMDPPEDANDREKYPTRDELLEKLGGILRSTLELDK